MAGPLDDAKALEAKGLFQEALGKYRVWLKDHPEEEHFSEVLFHAVDLCSSPKDSINLLRSALESEKSKTTQSIIFRKIRFLS